MSMNTIPGTNPPEISERTNLRKYRIELPNLADDANLDPYEFRLLAHYKRVGTCTEGLQTTARKCRMSSGKVSRVRQSLSDKKWISLERVLMDSGRYRYVVTVMDRWGENYATYSQMRKQTVSPGEDSPSLAEGGVSVCEYSPSHDEADPSPDEGGVSVCEYSPSLDEANPSPHEGSPSLDEGSPSLHEAGSSPHEGSPSPHEGKNEQFKNQPIKNEPVKNQPIKKESENEKTNFQKVWIELEQLCGPASSATARLVDTWLEKHPLERIRQAIELASDKSARSPNYVDQVLINWESNGYPLTREEQVLARAYKPGKGLNGTGKPGYQPPEYSAADLAAAERINEARRLQNMQRARLAQKGSAGRPS